MGNKEYIVFRNPWKYHCKGWRYIRHEKPLRTHTCGGKTIESCYTCFCLHKDKRGYWSCENKQSDCYHKKPPLRDKKRERNSGKPITCNAKDWTIQKD